MNRILLIRHGSTDLSGRVLYGRAPGVHLNEEGRQQADRLSAAVAGKYKIACIVSSPLERATETAHPLTQACGIPVTTDANLTEIDFGKWVGQSFKHLQESDYWRTFNRKRALSWPPDGETMTEVQARAWRAIHSIVVEARPDDTIALFTHGDVIRAILVLLLGVSIDHIHRLEVSPGSVSEFLIGDHDPVVTHINQIFY